MRDVKASSRHRDYLPRLMALRQPRGMTTRLAREWLQDTVVLGTLMLEQAAVDGLVSGAVHRYKR